MSAVEQELIRDAASRTLKATGVRLVSVGFSDLNPSEGWSREDGVADLAGARVSVRNTFGPTPGFDATMEELGERLADRFPWLGIETEKRSDAPPIDSVTVYAAGRRYHRFGDVWSADTGVDDIPGSPARVLGDPTRILEDLQRIEGARRLDQQNVRDVVSDHYAGNVDAPARWPKRRRREREQLYVEVWIDGDGLIRKVISSPTRGTCFRPGLLFRAASYIERRRTGEALEPPSCDAGRPWRSLELWDFGIEVDIKPPDDAELSDFKWRDLVGDAIALWRRRQRWKKQRNN